MPDSSAPTRGTIYTFRDFPHLQASCKICAALTTIELGVITGGCSHIDVVWCEDDGDARAH
jgi:hypothetical protein